MAASTSLAPRRTRPERSLARNEALTAYLFISPYLIIAGIFTVGLLAYAFYISLTDLKATFARTSHFIGLANYLRALRDGDFQLSLINVFWYWVVVTTLQTTGAILLAVLLNTRLRASASTARCSTPRASPRQSLSR